MKRKHFLLSLAVITVPVIIFYMLNTGRQQYMRLPVYGEKIPPDGVEYKDTVYYQVPDFKVVNQHGDTITQASLNDGIYLVNFFFATCKDICPSMNRRLKAVYDELEELAYKNRQLAEKKKIKAVSTPVKVISFTVDPKNDSVAALAAYAKKFDIKGSNWHFVTTDQESTFKIGRGFLLPVSIEDRTVDHSRQILLIDKSNRIRGMYDALSDAEMKRLSGEIKVLLYEYNEHQH